MAFHFREARETDVQALATLHVQTFNETHRGGRPGGPSYELREHQWHEAFQRQDGSWFFTSSRTTVALWWALRRVGRTTAASPDTLVNSTRSTCSSVSNVGVSGGSSFAWSRGDSSNEV